MADLIERTINRLNPSGGQIVVSEPAMRLALEDTLRQASDALLRMREALEELHRSAADMLIGVDVHNRLGPEAPARRANITGQVIDRLAMANASARSVLSSLEGEGFNVAPSRGSASEAPHSASQSLAWQPIETAPRDGTHVMVFPDNRYGGHGWAVAKWGSGHFGGMPGEVRHLTGWISDGGFFMGPQPTHWMPLPEPPQDQNPITPAEEGGEK